MVDGDGYSNDTRRTMQVTRAAEVGVYTVVVTTLGSLVRVSLAHRSVAALMNLPFTTVCLILIRCNGARNASLVPVTFRTTPDDPLDPGSASTAYRRLDVHSASFRRVYSSKSRLRIGGFVVRRRTRHPRSGEESILQGRFEYYQEGHTASTSGPGRYF